MNPQSSLPILRSLSATGSHGGSVLANSSSSALSRWASALRASGMAVAMLVIGAGQAQGQTVVTKSTVGNDTWTCPTGVSSVQVEAYGGGGGGGGAGKNWSEAGGGAGGSYLKYTASVTPGTTYQLTVGAGGTGGTGGTSAGGTGGTGGTSYFGNTSAGSSAGAVVLAVGGPGGIGNNTQGTVTSYTTTAGGTATNSGNIPSSGATSNTAGTSGGSPPGGSAKGSGAGGAGAGTAGSAGGGAGAAGLGGAGNGTAGTAPGGGGSGGCQVTNTSNGTGGAGGAGRIVLTYTATTPTINTTGTLSAISTGQGTASIPLSFSASGANLTADIGITAPSGFEISTSSGSGYSSSLTLTQSSGTVGATTIYVRLTAAASAGSYSGTVGLSSSGATSATVAIPACTVVSPFTVGNLAVEQLATNGTSSTLSFIEVNPSTASQSAPVNSYLIPSKGSSALRQSNAGSTGRISLSNDGTLLAFSGFEDPTGVTDETSITLRGAGSLSSSYAYALQASYTDSVGTGDQTRGATYNNGTWYMTDKNGIWLNGATTAANTTNLRGHQELWRNSVRSVGQRHCGRLHGFGRRNHFDRAAGSTRRCFVR